MKLISIKGPTANGPRTARGTVVKNEDGTRIEGIKSIALRMEINEPITAVCVLYAQLDETSASGEFVMINPLTGKTGTIQRIEFVDGTEFVG